MSQKSTKSSAASKFEVSTNVINKLKGNWSYNDELGITENWEAAFKLAPEIAEGNVPLQKKNYLKYISERVESSVPQKNFESNPFDSYISAATNKKSPATPVIAADQAIDMLTSIPTSSLPSGSSHETIAAQLSPRDRAIFEREIAETNKILGLV